MSVLGTLTPASPLNASDDVRLVFSTDSNETLSSALANVPADFNTMIDLSWQVEYRLGGVRDNDVYTLGIYIANGSTMLAGASATLADAQQVSSSVTSTTDTTSPVTAFSYVNATADKATWDGASVYLVQTHSKSQGGDGVGVEVDYVAITGNYVLTHIVSADDLESTTEVSTPTVSQIHVLSADDLEVSAELSSPAVGQKHALTAASIESSSELSTPVLGVIHNISADDLEIGSEVSQPTAGMIHNLTAQDLEATFETSQPLATEIIAPRRYNVNLPDGYVGYHVNMPANFTSYKVRIQ